MEGREGKIGESWMEEEKKRKEQTRAKGGREGQEKGEKERERASRG